MNTPCRTTVSDTVSAVQLKAWARDASAENHLALAAERIEAAQEQLRKLEALLAEVAGIHRDIRRKLRQYAEEHGTEVDA